MILLRINLYENTRLQKAFSASAAGTAKSGRSCDYQRTIASDRSLSHIWCRTHLDFQLAQGTSNKQIVFLIVDGHPVHPSRQVKRRVDQNRKRIRLFYLPGYSPQWNPDEFLNQDVKTNAVGRQRPKDQPEMMQQVRSYLRSTQRQPQIVKNFFKHKDVQ